MAAKKPGKFLAKTRQRLRGLAGVTPGVKNRQKRKINGYLERTLAQMGPESVIASLPGEDSEAGGEQGAP